MTLPEPAQYGKHDPADIFQANPGEDVQSVLHILRDVTYTPLGQPAGLGARRLPGKELEFWILPPPSWRDIYSDRQRTEAIIFFDYPDACDPFDRRAVLHRLVHAVAQSAAHEFIEWLRIDGKPVWDPHRLGEPQIHLPAPPEAMPW